jgi:hypothetical protein
MYPSKHGVHVFLSSLTVPMQSLQVLVASTKYKPAPQAVHVVKSALTVPTQFLHLTGVVEESDQVLLVPQGSHDNLSLVTAPLQSLQAASTVLKYLYSAHGVQVFLSGLTVPAQIEHFFAVASK